MKKIKSIVVVLLLVALVLSMLTGCTGTGTKSGKTYTFTSIGNLKDTNVSITFTGGSLSGTYVIKDTKNVLNGYLSKEDLSGRYTDSISRRNLYNSKGYFVGCVQIVENGTNFTCDFYK